MFKKIIFAAAIISSSCFASNDVFINDNDNQAITLSSNNINRLFIKSDKITDVRFPKNSMQQNDRDPDGSIYVTNVIDKPFTLFVTSEKGHHFSLTVTGEKGLGRTIDFIPKTASKEVAAKWETKSPYETTLTSLMSLVIKGEIPDGYGLEKLSFSKRIKFSKSIKLKPVVRLRGDHLLAEVFDVENSSNKTIRLNDRWFAKKNLASSLSSKILKPKSKVRLFVIKEVKNVKV